jgi:hypothetical protein
MGRAAGVSVADEPAGPNGGYITRGRALALEREMAALEARLGARVDELERELAQTRALVFDAVRGQATALLEVLRPKAAEPTQIRQRGGGSR